ncbi:hypothetical protein E2542_SST16735 [Spatholobus suberectus]|nr:hypothetical protein E2542_SST16735 [Spatholobus suberectus]
MAEINNAMNNPPNQHNNHKGDDRSLTSASTTCHIKGKTPTSSGTAMNSCSGTGSFKNYGTGRQIFYKATINSDPCVKNRTGSNNVVYDGGGGPQDFQGAKINGLTVTPSSGTPSSSRSQQLAVCSTALELVAPSPTTKTEARVLKVPTLITVQI